MWIDDLISEIKDMTPDTKNIKKKFRLTLDKQDVDYTQTEDKNFEAKKIDMYTLI